MQTDLLKVDISNPSSIDDFLSKLHNDIEPKWGLMKAQHMIEHLALVMQHTNGKKQAPQRVSDEEALANKLRTIYTDIELPMGLKSPLAAEVPGDFEFSSIDDAKAHLKNEIKDFHFYFSENPEAAFVQPRLGKMNYKEWNVFHNKHFTHHFKQFGLL